VQWADVLVPLDPLRERETVIRRELGDLSVHPLSRKDAVGSKRARRQQRSGGFQPPNRRTTRYHLFGVLRLACGSAAGCRRSLSRPQRQPESTASLRLRACTAAGLAGLLAGCSPR
jgi:hypothetical protein